MQKTMMAMVVVAAGAAASANVLTATNGSTAFLNAPSNAGPAGGETIATAVTIFGPMSGAFYADGTHTVGGADNLTSPLMGGVDVTSTVVDNGDGTRTLTVQWNSPNFENLLPDGFGFTNGDPVDTIGFEFGGPNTGSDAYFDADFQGVADPFNAVDGVFESAFTLLGPVGGTLFSGDFFVTDNGDGTFGGITTVSAGGAPLNGFEISGAIASVTYFVPAPSAAAVLGLGGLVATRRRR